MPQSLIRLSWSTIAAVAMFVPANSLQAESPGYARVVCPPKCAVPGAPATHPLMPAMPDAAPIPGFSDAPPTPGMPDAMPTPGTPEAAPMPSPPGTAPMPMPTDPTLPPEAPAPDATTPDAPTPDPVTPDPATPDATTPDTTTPDTTTPDDAANMPEPLTSPGDDTAPAPQTPLDLSFDSGLAAGGDEVAYADNPNMLGDLLRATRNVTFPYNLAGDDSGSDANGTVLIRNTKVSENNTAIPRNRVSFRYNWFHNGAQVDGLRLQPFSENPGGTIGVPLVGSPPQSDPTLININGRTVILDSPDSRFGVAPFEGNRILRNQANVAASRNYDVHQYTIGWEQTFLDDNASLEVRVPFTNSVDSDLNLTATRAFSEQFGEFRFVEPVGDTLGGTDFELRDLQFVLKGVLYNSRSTVISSGLGVTIPTAEDVSVVTTDAIRVPADDDLNPIGDFPTDLVGTGQVARFVRTRDIEIENETYSLSPFLAVASAPTDRIFFNGFLQVDLPIGQDNVRIRQRNVDTFLLDPTQIGSIVYDSPVGNGKIRDQSLLHIDLGGGYWLYRDPEARGLTGFASLFELHYTTTLQDADVFEQQSQIIDARGNVLFVPRGADGIGVERSATRVGNTSNRLDILNATVGGVAVINEQATLAIGAGMPLRTDGGDKLFDVEVQAQFNLFFDRLGEGAFGNPSSFR